MEWEVHAGKGTISTMFPNPTAAAGAAAAMHGCVRRRKRKRAAEEKNQKLKSPNFAVSGIMLLLLYSIAWSLIPLALPHCQPYCHLSSDLSRLV